MDKLILKAVQESYKEVFGEENETIKVRCDGNSCVIDMLHNDNDESLSFEYSLPDINVEVSDIINAVSQGSKEMFNGMDS